PHTSIAGDPGAAYEVGSGLGGVGQNAHGRPMLALNAPVSGAASAEARTMSVYASPVGVAASRQLTARLAVLDAPVRYALLSADSWLTSPFCAACNARPSTFHVVLSYVAMMIPKLTKVGPNGTDWPMIRAVCGSVRERSRT